MGAGGPLIFDDDVAWDVKGVFDEAFEETDSIDDAIERVTTDMSDAIEDSDDGPIVWIALAALLIEKDRLTDEVKAHALKGIESEMANEPGGRWEEEDYRERKAILEQFKKILLGEAEEANFIAVDH